MPSECLLSAEGTGKPPEIRTVSVYYRYPYEGCSLFPAYKLLPPIINKTRAYYGGGGSHKGCYGAGKVGLPPPPHNRSE